MLFLISKIKCGEGSDGGKAKVVNSSLEVRKFELQSCYYVHFQTNTIGKGMNSFIPLSYGFNNITALL